MLKIGDRVSTNFGEGTVITSPFQNSTVVYVQLDSGHSHQLDMNSDKVQVIEDYKLVTTEDKVHGISEQ